MKTGDRSAEGDPRLSVIVTCYCEEASLEEFFARLRRTLGGLGCAYEIIMVNDGSTDRTWEIVKRLYREHAEVRCVVDFYRNSGQRAALSAGVSRARGEMILIMDSDLQLAPEEIPRLLVEYLKGSDVVAGYREKRKDPLARVLASKLANAIMRRASGSDFRDFGCTFKIYDANLVRALDFGPRHLFSDVELIAAAGRRREVPITHYPRVHGKSGWTFRKLWRYNMDNVVILSERPFQYIGVGSLLLGALFALRIMAAAVVDIRLMREVSTGLVLNSVVASSLVTVGILCMIGELTVRIFTTTRQRPFYLVRVEMDKLAGEAHSEGRLGTAAGEREAVAQR